MGIRKRYHFNSAKIYCSLFLFTSIPYSSLFPISDMHIPTQKLKLKYLKQVPQRSKMRTQGEGTSQDRTTQHVLSSLHTFSPTGKSMETIEGSIQVMSPIIMDTIRDLPPLDLKELQQRPGTRQIMPRTVISYISKVSGLKKEVLLASRRPP
ncbi:unnamed protein product [Protopolystoma xenopodis]|uniref:Uncharacterized protein n=1 Tax=Protopolystoma xenopodis TaxID=117903 RepID=A0A3S5CIY5_9PLAT|nr:unnamed protein product [Protopolystoma xenopodis]